MYWDVRWRVARSWDLAVERVEEKGRARVCVIGMHMLDARQRLQGFKCTDGGVTE